MEHFKQLIITGSLGSIKKYYEENKDECDIHYGDNYAFRFSCIKGNTNVAKWLISLKPKNIDDFDIHYNNDHTFTYLCIYNRVETLKWFLTLDSHENFDFNNRNNQALYFSCSSNFTEIIDILRGLDLGKDFGNLHNDNESIFQHCIRCKYIYVTSFMISLFKKERYISENLFNIIKENNLLDTEIILFVDDKYLDKDELDIKNKTWTSIKKIENYMFDYYYRPSGPYFMKQLELVT